MSNKKEDIKENKNILDSIKDYSPSIIGVLTFLGLICFNILKFIEYIEAQFYFDYYGLNINLYKYSDQGFIYGLCLSLVFFLAIMSLPFFIKQVIDNVKLKRIVSFVNIRNVIIILLFNYIWIYSMLLEKIISIVLFCLFIVVEIIITWFIFYCKEEKDVSFGNVLKFVPIYILMLILCIGVSDMCNLRLKKEYRVISDNKVIVYSNNDYYLTLDCKIEDDKLIMYRGKQNKIDTDDVYSELIEFDEVIINEKDS